MRGAPLGHDASNALGVQAGVVGRRGLRRFGGVVDDIPIPTHAIVSRAKVLPLLDEIFPIAVASALRSTGLMS